MHRTRNTSTISRRSTALGLALALVLAPGACDRHESTIPERLSDGEFWSLSTDLSEQGGYFHSDNFVSNELAFQYVLPELQAAVQSDVYVGVGPDQNFTYLVALRPRIAFIVDIRRQNMLQHLMYKALIEMSSDRADFLARLFSRRRMVPPRTDAPADSLFSWLAALPRDTVLFRSQLDSVVRHLDAKGIALDAADIASIEYVFASFFEAGPALTYSSNVSRGFVGRGMPSYRMLMTATDRDGVNRGYLGSEENFHVLKDMQERNLIVPVVGDFGGSKALRAVGNWVRGQGGTIRTFYVSNVEQYLFQQPDAWRRFYDNVSDMPMHRDARFIRSISTRGYRRQHPAARSASTTSSVDEVLELFHTGRLQSYGDIIDLAR
jgi:hypothetical protein